MRMQSSQTRFVTDRSEVRSFISAKWFAATLNLILNLIGSQLNSPRAAASDAELFRPRISRAVGEEKPKFSTLEVAVLLLNYFVG